MQSSKLNGRYGNKLLGRVEKDCIVNDSNIASFYFQPFSSFHFEAVSYSTDSSIVKKKSNVNLTHTSPVNTLIFRELTKKNHIRQSLCLITSRAFVYDLNLELITYSMLDITFKNETIFSFFSNLNSIKMLKRSS